MGTSNWQNISYNIDLVRKLDPQSILDIGIGFGRWGILFREFLEIWDGAKYDGKWQRVIDGVEIYPGYIKDYHRYFYNNIYTDDALRFLGSTVNKYDLINLGDVVEHFSKTDGEELIKFAMTKGKYVLINIPIGKHWQQAGSEINPYEAHKSIWYNNDFTKYRHNIIKTFNDNVLREYSVILLSANRIVFTKKYGRYFYLKNILKHKLGLKKVIEKFEDKKRKS
ncbi:MAG: class I SAM-dependent methyltransferase [Ignavibacteria bacterium]|nr:class I SAM-dependent methyltransferase [Ignavibacteria bacterium]